jgi:hypothetical protein
MHRRCLDAFAQPALNVGAPERRTAAARLEQAQRAFAEATIGTARSRPPPQGARRCLIMPGTRLFDSAVELCTLV